MPPAKSNKVITLPSAESNVRVWRKRRMRNATGDDAYSRSAAKVIERAQKALLRGADRVDDGVSQEPSLSVPPPYSQSLTDLQIQDEEVSRSLIFRPFVDQKSGAWVFDGVDKGQEGQWLSHLSGPIPQPSEDQGADGSSAPVDDVPEYVRGPFTDSGYASAMGPIVTAQEPLPVSTSEDQGNEGDDATVYTGGSSIGGLPKQSHVQELANEIYQQLQLEEHSEQWEAISAHTPTLIKAFAIRVGSFFGTAAGRRAMRFLHKHSRDIINAIDLLLVSDDDQPKSPGPENMSLAEKMALWADKEDVHHDEAEHADLFDGVAVDGDDGLTMPELLSYRNVLLGSPPYEWLMSTLRRELLTSTTRTPDAKIRNQILRMLPCGEISRHHLPKVYNMTFGLPWDIFTDFWNSVGPGGLKAATVFLDGDYGFSQQTNILCYTQERWPFNGEHLLSVLDDLHTSSLPLKRSSRTSVADKTRLSALVQDQTLRVAVNGLSCSVAECAEQLAWLVIALHHSPINDVEPRVPYLVGDEIMEAAEQSAGAVAIHFRMGDHVTSTSEVPRTKMKPLQRYREPETHRDDSDGASSALTAEGSSSLGGLGEDSRRSLESMATTISARESLDSDMLSISDRSDHINPFGQEPGKSACLNEILHRLLEDWRWMKSCQPSSEKSSQPSSAHQTESSATQPLSSQPGSSQKRSLPDEDDDQFDDGDNGSRLKKRVKDDTPPRKFLACPFWKKNPRAHRDCFTYKLSRIKDVKQHLARQHTPIHCERCLKVFEDRRSKSSHFESDEPCVRGQHGELDGVTNEQNEDLRRKSKRGQTEAEQWYAIWHILFPSLSRPDSPYMDFEHSQEFSEWEEFCQRRGSAVVAEELNRHLLSHNGSSPDWLPELLRIAQSGFRAAFEEFRSHSGRLPSASAPSSETYDAVGGWLGTEELQGLVEEHEGASSPFAPGRLGRVDENGALIRPAEQDSVELQHFGEWLDWGDPLV